MKHKILIKISSNLLYSTHNSLIELKKEYKPIEKMKKGDYYGVALARTSKYADFLTKYPDLLPANSTGLILWNEYRITTSDTV